MVSFRAARHIVVPALLAALALPLVPSTSAHATEPAIDGALTSTDSLVPSQGNGGYDVQHYDINLTFKPATIWLLTVRQCNTRGTIRPATISATTTVTATAEQPLRSFSLDFKGLTISQVTVNGQAATWSRIANKAADSYKVVVRPAAPVEGQFTVALTYSGQPEAYSFEGGAVLDQGWLPNQHYCEGNYTVLPDGGYTAIGQPSGSFVWYPSNMAPTDKATYTMRLTAPNAYSAVGIGRLVNKTKASSSQTTWLWEETMPTPTFLTLASFGRYAEHSSTVSLDGQTVPVWAYGTAEMESDVGGWNHYNALTAEILQWGTENFGPYQPSAAGYVVAPANVGWALETVGRPFFSGNFDDRVYVHEYVHQWAGNSVTGADWSDLWLAEGFATYGEWLWDEDHGGANAVILARDTYWRRTGWASALWAYPVAHPNRSQLWGTPVYQGGGVALAALRSGVGDETFDRIVKAWFTRYQNSVASTDDFVALA
ncbi:MAG: hypothetical protein LBL92_02340, partial [Propionibacteriaceae bacterium]|nr:hypothetical protein [Propionibacteriaceae bacterium]